MIRSITILTPEQAEAAAIDFVVCMRVGTPTPFTDNVETRCAHCGHGIHHRPDVPSRPMKICLPCCLDLAKGGRA